MILAYFFCGSEHMHVDSTYMYGWIKIGDESVGVQSLLNLTPIYIVPMASIIQFFSHAWLTALHWMINHNEVDTLPY